MQSSLARLHDGIGEALREDVLPAVDDPYARSQVLAACELLANLGERVEWRCDGLREEIEALRAVLAAAPEPPQLVAEELPRDNAGLLAARDAHLDALARLQERGLETPELRDYLRASLDAELARLRTGMYRS